MYAIRSYYAPPINDADNVAKITQGPNDLDATENPSMFLIPLLAHMPTAKINVKYVKIIIVSIFAKEFSIVISSLILK